jgi:hypothetical protein
MAEREDWLAWDNSMKTHIDQIEVRWKNDAVLAMEKQAKFNQGQNEFNDLVAVAIEDINRTNQRNTGLIFLGYCLGILNFIVAIIAFRTNG